MIPKFIIRASRGADLPIHGDGEAVRSYLYVDDVARAFDAVLHKVGICRGRVYRARVCVVCVFGVCGGCV
jgi:dTDP-D-glucose 4,6-dehydratase